MTTLIPREPYSPEELARLYPKSLKLQLVQVVSLLETLIVRSALTRAVPSSW
jgi:acid phosphatase